ncbi:MAG TPA: hypothetical protein VNO31_51275 [Umezawaea sp.]|nr:hypothetical protein [Umezawaea sp.]
MITVLGFTSAATAAPTDHREPTATSVRVEAPADAPDFSTAANGSKCGATLSWGKIRYQACFSWACTSTCSTRGYLGIINTATSARTVTWDLDIKSPWTEEHDDSGTYTLAAGAQQTIWSRYIYSHPGCGFSFTESLKVQYDSAGFSPYTTATATLPCG